MKAHRERKNATSAKSFSQLGASKLPAVWMIIYLKTIQEPILSTTEGSLEVIKCTLAANIHVKIGSRTRGVVSE
ncbi:MAG: hypothetical protein ACO2ZZ_09150 [Cyclobacteriaceae bacterium]